MNALKKMLVLILLPVLLCSSAMASEAADGLTSWSYEGRVGLLDYNKVLKLYNEQSRLYCLADAYGNRITEPLYSSIYGVREGLLEVTDQNGNEGIITDKGETVVACQYADIKVLSDRWQLGVLLESATAEHYDYTSYNGDYFLVKSYDVFYLGQRIGTLERADYKNGKGYGAYLLVENLKDSCVAYDKSFASRPIENYYYEYDYDYSSDTYTHVATGMQAFCEGCTLNEDEVEQSIQYKRDSGTFVGLQGQTLITTSGLYSSADAFSNGYCKVQHHATYLYGVIDEQGKEIIPCEYDYIRPSSYSGGLFAGGYQAVEKDGKIGYYNTKGELSCEVSYAKANAEYNNCFLSLTDLDGKARLVTAAKGLLPDAYAKVDYLSNTGRYVPVWNDADEIGLLNVNGSLILPFAAVNEIDVSWMGNFAIVQHSYDSYTVYVLGDEAAQDEPAQDASAQAEPAAADETQSWACPGCGTSNSGNFCTECGTPKPVELVSVCPGCGHDAGEATPNFCPECGAAMNAA